MTPAPSAHSYIGPSESPISPGDDATPSFAMLRYALIFFIIALIAALFGFTGFAAGAAEIAKILFYVFLVIAAVSLVMGLIRRGP